MTAIAQSAYMTQRHTRALLRQPWFVAITLVQPIIWLVLFGQLFRSVVEIPGFTSSASYLDYLVPGVIAMTALVSPAHRSSLITGRLVHEGIAIVIQATIIGAMAWLLGAQFESGPIGFAILLACAVLLAATFGALSNGLALVLRQRESVIGANQFLGLPLTFMSAAFMPLDLAPGWIATIARFNPLNWAVEAGREGLAASPDFGYVVIRLGGLLVVAVIGATVATRAFRSYQRSI
jgi:ABC-2 type transport system permease protein